MSDFLPPVAVILSASITELKAKLGEATAEMEGFQSHTEKISNVGKLAFGALAGGVAAVGVESLKMAGDFQQQTSLLVTAAGESASHLGLVRNGILDIAKSTGASTDMLTEGMYQVEKAGIQGADGLKVLKAAAQGAAEEGANLSTVTNAMTSIMASYHIPASQSVEVMNALKTAAGGSKDTMENFASSLSTVLPIASAAGLDFAQVGGAIAGLTRHGTSAAEATQELAFTIRNLQAPNKVAVKAMEQMGISAVDVSQNLGQRGLGGTLEYLVDTISKHMGPSGLVLIDTFKKSQSAAADMNAMIAAMPPELQKLADGYRGGSLTMGDFNKAIASMPATQANLAKQFEVLANRSNGFSDALRSGSPQMQTVDALLKAMLGGSTGLNTALMTTGDNQAYVDEMTRKTSASIKNHTTDVEGWKATAKLLNTQLGQLHQDISTMAIALGDDLIPAVTSTIGWFQRHKTEAEVLAGVMGGALTIAIGTYLVGALQSANEALTLTGRAAQIFGVQAAEGEAAAELPLLPWIAAVGLVGIAAYELYNHWDDVWGFIKSATSTAVDFVKQHLVVFSALLGPVALAAAELYRHWDAVWSAIKATVESVEHVISGLEGAIASTLGAVGRRLATWASEAGTFLLQAGKDLINGLVNGIKSAASGAVEAVKNVGQSVIDGAKSIFSIHSPSRVFHELGSNLTEGLANGIHAGTPTAVAAMQASTKKVTDAATAGVKEALAAQAQAQQQQLSDMLQKQGDFASAIANGALGSSGDVVGLFSGNGLPSEDAAPPSVDSLQQTLQAQLQGIKDFGQQLQDVVSLGGSQDLVAQIAKGGVQKGASLAEALVASGSEGVGSISSLLDQIRHAAADDGVFTTAGFGSDLVGSGLSTATGTGTFGSGGAGSGAPVVNITVQGNVLDGRQLADMVYQAFLIKKQEKGPLMLG